MEANIILFLKKSEQPSNVKKFQKNVWGHASDLETHTVETHIYRLRKKIKEKFQDDDFIKGLKMVIKLVKKNKFAKDLFTKKYKSRVVKPKKGKGSFKKKKKRIKV